MKNLIKKILKIRIMKNLFLFLNTNYGHIKKVFVKAFVRIVPNTQSTYLPFGNSRNVFYTQSYQLILFSPKFNVCWSGVRVRVGVGDVGVGVDVDVGVTCKEE